MRNYYPTKVMLWMLVNGREVPLHSISIKFSMNHVPICRAEMAVGSLVTNTSIRSSIHDITELLREGTPVKIVCALQGVAGTLNNRHVNWPGLSQPFTVFEGTVLSSSPEKGQGLKISIGLAHWMEVLDRTTWNNAIISSASSSQVLQPAFFGQGAETSNLPFADFSFRRNQGATTTYQEDMWGKALKPALLDATSPEPTFLNTSFKKKEYLEKLYGEFIPNTPGHEAIKRMDDERYIAYRPLPLFPPDKFTGVTLETINLFLDTIGRIIFADGQTPTLWSKLLAFSQLSMFPLIPLVETASVVPWVPVSNRTWLTLTDDDVWSLGARVVTPKKYRGVIILENPDSPVVQDAYQFFNIPGVLGFYDIAQANSGISKETIGKNPGTVLVMNAPDWLRARVSLGNIQSFGRTLKYGITTAGNPTRINPTFEQNTITSFAAKKDIGNKFAKAIYMTEAFKEKSLTLSTRLRFDICPGSHIKLVGRGKQFNIPGYTAEGMKGTVDTVTINLSAEAGNCSTQLDLSHVLTEHEKDFYLEEHPISGNVWYGGPLTHVDGVTPDLV